MFFTAFFRRFTFSDLSLPPPSKLFFGVEIQKLENLKTHAPKHPPSRGREDRRRGNEPAYFFWQNQDTDLAVLFEPTAFAARLEALSTFGEMRHKGASNMQQYEELRCAARESERGVSVETLSHLDTLWRPRLEATLNEEKYSCEVVQLLRSIRPLKSNANGSTTALLSGPQPLASLAPPKASRAQARAVAGSQNIVHAFIRGSQEQ